MTPRRIRAADALLKSRRRATVMAPLVVALAASACLDDLDPPTVCPPPAKHAAGHCDPVFATLVNQPSQCLTQPEQFECLAGKRASCDCRPDECPTSDAACYPPGDCPPEVVNQVGDGAKCFRLTSNDFASPIPQLYSCECGCMACAAVCDGYGPTVGVWDDGTPNKHAFPIIDIKRYMPKSGRLGVYVRARGLSNATIGIATGDPTDLFHLAWQNVGYYLVTPLDSFAESVFFDQQFVGGKPAYSWSTSDDRPAVIAIVPPTGTKERPAPSLFEIDCVIPFVLPK